MFDYEVTHLFIVEKIMMQLISVVKWETVETVQDAGSMLFSPD